MLHATYQCMFVCLINSCGFAGGAWYHRDGEQSGSCGLAVEAAMSWFQGILPPPYPPAAPDTPHSSLVTVTLSAMQSCKLPHPPCPPSCDSSAGGNSVLTLCKLSLVSCCLIAHMHLFPYLQAGGTMSHISPEVSPNMAISCLKNNSV